MLHSSGVSAAEKVYDEVKELILTNELSGGELLSEGEVAGRYEVSRTPVREAFLRLQAEGWMRLYPKRGALVVPVTDREARDVVEARQLLESHAVRAVAAAGTVRAELVADLRRNVAEHREVEAADVASFSRIDAAFHQRIVVAGDNELLAGFYAGLGERHRRMTTASVHRDPEMAQHIITDHAALLDLIERADADGFDAALHRHLSAVHNLPGGTR